MRIVGVIPERMNSSRFYGKPLARILGKPMVQHVWDNSKQCNMLDELWVATGDMEIIDCVKSFKGNIIKTRDNHFRASNQVAEAVENIMKPDIVCMIQGDEPMVTAEMIEASIKPLLCDETIRVTNLMGKLDFDKENDMNEIKVVVDKQNNALYFSRNNIPFDRNNKLKFVNKQVCVISFRYDTLLAFPLMKETPLEKLESVDMLRFLENGIKVRMVPVDRQTFSVDTTKDLEYVEYLLKGVS